MPILRKKQKTTLVIFLVFEFFITSAFPASAGLFGGGLKIPSPSSVAAELEKRYNLNLTSIQDQSQTFNVAGNKTLTPEASLFFSPSDPKEGEKLSAKAFPVYFSNSEESLYYTWFLKRDGCNLANNVSNQATLTLCDRDGDSDITVEDWKIEAARIIAQNGYTGPSTASGPDNDGYNAKHGGENQTNTPDHCYVNDAVSGVNYELADGGQTDFGCPTGTDPVCMVGDGTVTSGTNNALGGNTYFDTSDNNTCSVSGYPTCSSGTPHCSVGTPRCVADPANTTSCGSAVASTCTATSSSGAAPYCSHLFPNANNNPSGNGSFGLTEESFWGTDPNDPDTADNGNKDEANVVGLGQSTFTWNYTTGDQVGVAIEGTSMVPTKHNDSSYMIMWAFSKNKCLPRNLGSYTKSIKGYNVVIPTTHFDLNECIEDNLVDPTQGGQATRLEVGVTATPDNPLNDASSDKAGDSVIAQASVSNMQRSLSDALFEWTVEIGPSISAFNNSGGTDITADLQRLGLLGSIKGNALDSITVKLDIPSTAQLGGRPLSAYLTNNIGYLRFKAKVEENFASGATRTGRSDVIVKFISSTTKIDAYRADARVRISGDMEVFLPSSKICDGLPPVSIPLDRTSCRIITNEVIGLHIDEPGLTNFHWTINGTPLTCSNSFVSSLCDDSKQNAYNFFPVTGTVGDVYTVVATANDVSSGESVTLTRTFHIVQPLVTIVSKDLSFAWPKLLGQYQDITGQAGCTNNLCDDFSTSIFQAFPGSTLTFEANFIPGFLQGNSTREWRVDGVLTPENLDPVTGAPITPPQISFTTTKPVLSIHNVNLTAQVTQSPSIRQALLDIWNVSPFGSAEVVFASPNQVELLDPGLAAGPQGERAYLAAIASYIPASVLFTFRILLSAALVLFSANFLLTLLQERRLKAFVASLPEKRF